MEYLRAGAKAWEKASTRRELIALANYLRYADIIAARSNS